MSGPKLGVDKNASCDSMVIGSCFKVCTSLLLLYLFHILPALPTCGQVTSPTTLLSLPRLCTFQEGITN